MRMTWDEFKARVDAEIAAQGADGGVEIWYIDVSYPDQSHPRTEIAAGIDARDGAGLYIST